MWFKNIRAYRLTSPFALSPEQLAEQLAQRAFQPCAKSQALALGWVPPLGGETSELVHAAAGRMLLKLKMLMLQPLVCHWCFEEFFHKIIQMSRILDR